MADFTFEDVGVAFNMSGTAQVFENGGIDPTSLIRTNQNWFVRVRLQSEGTLNAFIVGNLRIRLLLESMGAGPELNLPAAAVIVPLAPAVAPSNYLTNIMIAAGTVPAGTYKLVTTVTYENLGVPGPIAGYSEGQILQFYASV